MAISPAAPDPMRRKSPPVRQPPPATALTSIRRCVPSASSRRGSPPRSASASPSSRPSPSSR
eukprot:4263279-Prymnesium_polylepis.1